jgi:hypothetical protein
MIPKLTDDAISRLPLGSGRAELLEEIMSTVAPDRQDPDTLDDPTRLHSRRTRWVAPLAAAAVVAGLAGGTRGWQQHRPAPDGSDHVASLGLPEGQSVVLDAPGWKVDSLSGDGLVFRNGDADLEITSYDADQYDSYVTDREHIEEEPVDGRPITVLGRPALMWAYSSTDHTAIRGVEGGRWMEFRAQGLDEAAYLELLGRLRLTSEDEFAASLPESYVAEDERSAVAGEILADIEAVSGAGFPEGAAPSFSDGEAKDRYQFGAEVVGAYTCAWLESYENARSHDQNGQAQQALTVLGTSHVWPILRSMDEDGDYPDVLWQIADEARAGQLQEWYREGLGC